MQVASEMWITLCVEAEHGGIAAEAGCFQNRLQPNAVLQRPIPIRRLWTGRASDGSASGI
jgi:hypothetical protein